MELLEIIANVEKVVEEIRDYSKSQIKLWQRIPLLALEADGRTGFRGNYSKAYHNGFWALDGSFSDGHYLVYVDLSNGELVDEYVLKPARNKEVLQLVFNLEELDAQKIVTSLEKNPKNHILYVMILKNKKHGELEQRQN